jgi:Novel STAND NTPase 1
MTSVPPGGTAAGPAGSNPFVGLRRFDLTDSHLFFGRDEQTYHLLRRLRLMHFLAVIGPSGCGKSSLIRAGVMAALRDGFLADDGDWRLVTLQPGNGPLEAWVDALRPYAGPGTPDEAIVADPAAALDTRTGPIAILVDQFEELFQFVARTGKTNDARAFVDSMIRTGAPGARVYTILTMRSEYLAQCAEYPLLADAINSGLHLVSRMTPAQVRDAIVKPVHKAGAAITVALTNRLADEAAREADGLPVLQHALMRMWASRAPFEPLGESPLGTAGGLGEFLNDHAEQVYGSLSPGQKAATEKLFRCITEMTDEGNLVRRPSELDRIQASTGVPIGPLREVITAFEREGFLVVTTSAEDRSPLIDISHEAIARQWRRLGSKDPVAPGWIVKEARQRAALLQVERAAREWADNGRETDFLLKGLRLENAVRHIDGREAQLTEAGRRFLAASQTRDARLRWMTPKVLAPAITALVLIVGLALFSANQRIQREAETMRAAAAEAQRQVEASRAAAAETVLRIEQVESTPAPSPSPPVFTTRPQPSTGTAPKPAPTAVPGLPAPAPSLPTGAAGPPPANQIRPRVYVQIRDEKQRDQADRAAKALRDAKFIVPGIDVVSLGPSVTELRYLQADEEAEAKRAVGVLKGVGIDSTLRFVQLKVRSKARPFHYELWLAPPAAAK